MTAWHTIKVSELPDIENKKPYAMYKLPNGQVWVPNNMFDVGEFFFLMDKFLKDS